MSDGTHEVHADLVCVVHTPPVAHDQIVWGLDPPEPLEFALDYDNEGGLALDVQIVDLPLRGSVAGEPDAMEYSTSETFRMADRFRYLLDDGVSQSGVARVVVMAGPEPDPEEENAPPVASDFTTETLKNLSVSLDLFAHVSDPDGLETVEILEIGAATSGTALLDPQTGIVEYTPSLGFVGQDEFDFVVVDSHGELDSARVIVRVKGASLGFGAATVLENSPSNSFVMMLRAFPPEDYRDFEIDSVRAIPVGGGEPQDAPLEWFGLFHTDVMDGESQENLRPESGEWSLVWTAPEGEGPSASAVQGFEITIAFENLSGAAGVGGGPGAGAGPGGEGFPDTIELPEEGGSISYLPEDMDQRWFRLHIHDQRTLWSFPDPPSTSLAVKNFRARVVAPPLAGELYDPEFPAVSSVADQIVESPWFKAGKGEIVDVWLEDTRDYPPHQSPFLGGLYVRDRVGTEDGDGVPTIQQQAFRHSWLGGNAFVAFDYVTCVSLGGSFHRFLGFGGSYRDQDWVDQEDWPLDADPTSSAYRRARLFFAEPDIDADLDGDGEFDEDEDQEESEPSALSLWLNTNDDDEDELTDCDDEVLNGEDDRDDFVKLRLTPGVLVREMAELLPPMEPMPILANGGFDPVAWMKFANNIEIQIAEADGLRIFDQDFEEVVAKDELRSRNFVERLLDQDQVEFWAEGFEPGHGRLMAQLNANHPSPVDKVQTERKCVHPVKLKLVAAQQGKPNDPGALVVIYEWEASNGEEPFSALRDCRIFEELTYPGAPSLYHASDPPWVDFPLHGQGATNPRIFNERGAANGQLEDIHYTHNHFDHDFDDGFRRSNMASASFITLQRYVYWCKKCNMQKEVGGKLQDVYEDLAFEDGPAYPLKIYRIVYKVSGGAWAISTIKSGVPLVATQEIPTAP